MGSYRQAWIFFGLLTLLLLLLTVGIHAALQNNALGFDYMFYWHAGRGLFLEGLSPYSAEITWRIQLSAYGRPALPGEYTFPFSYPLPILWLPLPLYSLSYDWSQAAWMAVNLVAPLAAGMLLFPHAPKWLVLTLPLFYQMAFTWIIGNYALLIGVIFIVVFTLLLNRERPPRWADFLSGVALAWATNKPQMTWLYVILAILFAFRGRRWGMVAGFAAGMAGFHLAALALLPGWPAQWLDMARIYPQQQVHIPSLITYLDYLLPASTARVASLALALPLAAATLWLFWCWWQGRFSGLLLLAWCALITSLVDISALTPDQIVLLVPLFLWAVQQKASAGLGIGWFGAILLTYVFFFLTQFGIIPEVVDRGPLLVYIAWLAWEWRRFPAAQSETA